jgi:hypothetical protein
MALDTNKIDDAVLALLSLTLHDDCRAWKGLGLEDSAPSGPTENSRGKP